MVGDGGEVGVKVKLGWWGYEFFSLVAVSSLALVSGIMSTHVEGFWGLLVEVYRFVIVGRKRNKKKSQWE